MAYFIVDDHSDEQIVTTTKTKLQIENLEPGKTYEFQVSYVVWNVFFASKFLWGYSRILL